MLGALSALGAFPFDNEGDGMGIKSFRQFESWDMNVFHAEGALARLTIKVNMAVMVIAFSLFLAHLVVEQPASVLEGMHYVML